MAKCTVCFTDNPAGRRGCISCGAVMKGESAGDFSSAASAPAAAKAAPLDAFGKKCLIGLLFFVFGGAGAGLYAVFFSGSEVARLELKRGSVVEVGPVALSTGGPVQSRVGPVALSAAMNPIRVNLKAHYRPGRTRAHTSYTVTMRSADGRELWKKNGGLSTDKDSRSVHANTSVKLFSVAESADVYFETAFGDPDDVVSASLALRRNSAAVSPAFIFACVAGGLISLGGLMINRLRSRKRLA